MTQYGFYSMLELVQAQKKSKIVRYGTRLGNGKIFLYLKSILKDLGIHDDLKAFSLILVILSLWSCW